MNQEELLRQLEELRERANTFERLYIEEVQKVERMAELLTNRKLKKQKSKNLRKRLDKLTNV